MTRKDFELIASVLANHRAGMLIDYLDKEELRLPLFEMDLLTRRFAEMLKDTNPAFDAERFIKAAGN